MSGVPSKAPNSRCAATKPAATYRRGNPPGASQAPVDQAVQRGTKKRAAELVSRKNDEAYELDITADMLRDREWLTRSIGRDFVGCLCENLHAKHS